MSDSNLAIAVCIVSHNSARDLSSCLDAVSRQTLRPQEIMLVDSASTDDSVKTAARSMPSDIPSQLIELDENLGFAGGANRAIQESEAPYVLLLNPDTIPDPEFLQNLAKRVLSSEDLRLGAVAGRLVRATNPPSSARLDACGMMLLPTWRHLDRGSEQEDRGQFMNPERVFGATGAASLFVREALEDVAFGSDVFAPEFHSFREDAELCFRLQERSWITVYEPTAKCIHRRQVTPGRRREIPPEINYHSLKNRYLLRAYHQDFANFLITFVPTLIRDVLALFWVISLERTSLPAYSWLWLQRGNIWKRRRQIQGRRSCNSWSITRWFFRQSLPL